MLLENLGTQIRVVESSRRSQLQNREAALERLSEIIDASCAPIRMRRATRPSRSAREARLRAKKIESERKRSRRQTYQD